MRRFLVYLFFLIFIFGCNNINTNQEKPKISASIIPIASITNYIGEDDFIIKSIIPSGVSPHSFDLKTEDVKDIVDSKLIIYLGLDGIDNFLNKIIDEKKSIRISEFIKLIDTENNESKDHSHDEHSVDTHVWTSQENSLLIAEKITEELIKLDPKNKEKYENNLLSFRFETTELIREFQKNIEGKKANSFIVFHDAYNYLFEQIGIPKDKKNVFWNSVISGINIDEMKELKDKIKKENIKYIFSEPQFNTDNLIKFANENNLEILILDPLGQDTGPRGYIENLSNNLLNIEKIYE